jgi:hypothetical protein
VEGVGLAGEYVAGVVVCKVIVTGSVGQAGVRERGGSGDVLRAGRVARREVVWV